MGFWGFGVVLLELLDVAFDLVHLLGQRFHPVLLAQSIEFGVVGLFLVVLVNHFPLLLESGDQVLALAVRHQEIFIDTTQPSSTYW